MELDQIVAALRSMEADPNLITKTAYRANTEVWPDNRISFVDNHLAYLKAHPATDPQQYLSNLRLMIKRSPMLR